MYLFKNTTENTSDMSDVGLKNLSDILLELGYTQDQIAVYMAALTLGARPISTIAKQAGFGRSKTYDVVNSLVEQGLLQEYSRHNILHFSAVKPAKFLSLINERKQSYTDLSSRLETILPLVEALTHKKVNRTKIELWRGDEAVCSLWEETLAHPNTIFYQLIDYSTSWPAGRESRYVEWDKRYSEQRTKNNIVIHSICNRSPASDEAFRDSVRLKRVMKYIHSFNFTFEFAIHLDSIKVICNNDDLSGIVIRDAELAETFKAFFTAIWERLPDYTL